MTWTLVEVKVDATRTRLYLRLAGADGTLIGGAVSVLERDGIRAFVGLEELKQRVGRHRLDVDVGLNRACSMIVRGEALALPLELGWPEFDAEG